MSSLTWTSLRVDVLFGFDGEHFYLSTNALYVYSYNSGCFNYSMDTLVMLKPPLALSFLWLADMQCTTGIDGTIPVAVVVGGWSLFYVYNWGYVSDCEGESGFDLRLIPRRLVWVWVCGPAVAAV